MGFGFIETKGFCRSDANPGEPGSLGWESLGRVVQTRSLDAVARHFFDVGLAELCLDALVNTPCEMHEGIEHE